MTSPWIEDIACRVGWAIVHSLWQGALLGLVVLVSLPLVRSAGARHFIGFFSLLGMGFLLVANIARPQEVEPSRVFPVLANGVNVRGEGLTESTQAPETAPVAEFPDPAPSAGTPPPRKSVVAPMVPVTPSPMSLNALFRPAVPWIAAAWLLGIGLLSVRHLGGWWCVRRWRTVGISRCPGRIVDLGERARVRLGVVRSIPVLLSGRIAVPLLAGVVKPVILLPLALVNGLKPGEIEAILAHELAHFRRRDGWANLVQVCVETLMFYHPVVWWLGRRVRVERERATDDLVLRSGTARDEYISALARVAGFRNESLDIGPALAATGGSVLGRIRRMLAPPVPPRSSAPVLASGLAVAIAVVAVVIGHLSPGVARADGDTDVRIEIAPGESIQAALDAAEDGATLVLAEGVYSERVEITRSITLEGAGWDKTLLKPEAPAGDTHIPTIAVRGTPTAEIRGLKIQTAPLPATRGQVSGDAVVWIASSKITFSECAIVGPAGVGVSIADGSEVTMKDSLVAAIWGTGVAVEGARESAEASILRMDQCVVRNCYHRGITLGPGCDRSVIEGSWISGSAWHGIRYDHASPRIERNVIFKNARSGIYASGKTAATVKRNAFIGNEMGGVSCWFANTDRIEANLFHGNHRESLAVLGASTPTVTGNWFADEAIAVMCGKMGGESDKSSGRPTLENNLFTGGDPLRVDGQPASLPEGNVRTDGDVAAPFKRSNFGPVDDEEVAAKRYANAEEIAALCRNPKWPEPLTEETEIIPVSDTRDSAEWNMSGKPRATIDAAGPPRAERNRMNMEAHQAVKPWIDDAFQLDDVARREAAIASVRAALETKDAGEIRKGLVAFRNLGAIRFDKASFHDLVLPLLLSEDVMVRSMAPSALVMTGVREGDVDRLIAMTDDPDQETRQNAGTSVIWSVEKDLTGKAGEAILKLLNDESPGLRKEIMRSMWGGKYSPDLEARVIALSREEGDDYDALYFALSTQANKSEASVKRLIEFLAHRDTVNVAGRAAWGLRQGVSESEYGLVADAALAVIAARDAGNLTGEAMNCLNQYAGPGQVEGLKALLAKPGVEGEFRGELEKVLARIENRRSHPDLP